MSGLVHVSTFSGVGGIDLAMERAGIPTVAACEIDEKARGVLADRFPNTHRFTDVKEVTADALNKLGIDPRRTVLSGGFPCQDLSVAGARRGLGEGTRSGLWWELDRLMGKFRPAWVVFENVPGLLSATCACPGDGTCEKRGLVRECPGDGAHSVQGGACWGDCIARHGGVMGAVLGSLASRGYGYAYRVLDAQHFGVPQRRRRVVIVGCLGDSGGASAAVLLEPEGLPGNPLESIAPRPFTPTATRGRLEEGRAVGVLGDRAHTLTAEGHDASEDGTGRGTPVIAFDHKAGGEGDALREDQSPTLTSSGRDGMAVSYAPKVASTLTAGTSREGVNPPGRRQEDDHNVIAFHHQQDPISGKVSPALGSGADGMGVAYAADVVGTLLAAEHGPRLDTDSAAGGHLVAYAADVAGALDTNQGGADDNSAQAGHLVATYQKVVRSGARGADGELPPEVWAERGVAATLSPFDLGSETRTVELVKEGATVRRLTPIECERLQGFPDGHTATSNGKPQADSPRYKQMGNAVAVPVFEWVARRLVAVDAATTSERVA